MSGGFGRADAQESRQGYPRGVIHRDQVVINIVAASIPIIFGLVPGLFQELTAGARNFSLLLVFRHPRPYLPPIEAEPPKGLAVVGVVIIAATILAYLLN